MSYNGDLLYVCQGNFHDVHQGKSGDSEVGHRGHLVFLNLAVTEYMGV